MLPRNVNYVSSLFSCFLVLSLSPSPSLFSFSFSFSLSLASFLAEMAETCEREKEKCVTRYGRVSSDGGLLRAPVSPLDPAI